MRSFRHGVSIRLASITRESSGHGVVRFEGIELPVDEGKRRGNGYPDNDYDYRGSIEQIFFNRYSSRSVDDSSLPSPPPKYLGIKKGIMLELVERKAGGISWPSCRGENLESVGKDPKEMLFLGQRDKACPTGGKRWKRKSGGGGLLCSLGQLRCNHTYYTPDTLGTWKFHRVSRPRR